MNCGTASHRQRGHRACCVRTSAAPRRQWRPPAHYQQQPADVDGSSPYSVCHSRRLMMAMEGGAAQLALVNAGVLRSANRVRPVLQQRVHESLPREDERVADRSNGVPLPACPANVIHCKYLRTSSAGAAGRQSVHGWDERSHRRDGPPDLGRLEAPSDDASCRERRPGNDVHRLVACWPRNTPPLRRTR